MEKFTIHGRSQDGSICQLKIPVKKIFDINDQTVKNILQGKNKDITCDQNLNHIFPQRQPVLMKSELMRFADPNAKFGGHILANPNLLDHIYSKHDYPLAQGPALPPIDKVQFGSLNKSLQQVFGERTEYDHSPEQDCYEWIPDKVGLDAWYTPQHSIDSPGYGLMKNESPLGGAASLVGMSVVYTCNLHQCKIHCPCSCCRDSRDTCKMICKDYPCSDCNSQCTEHKLTLPRVFNPETDQYTMVTDRIDCARYMNVYAGIPINCNTCTKDVREHQIFHHVFHTRCKFCDLEMRPLRYMSEDMSLKSLKKAAKIINRKDEKTCSYCFSRQKGAHERKNHEETIHEGKSSSHKCNECGKSYLTSTSLQYHLQMHKGLPKLQCNKCNKSFVSTNGLDLHMKIVHFSEEDKQDTHICDTCEKSFTRSANLARHKRIHHNKTNVNFDFADSYKGINEFPCDICDKIFNRKDNLKRHKQIVHDGN